MKKIYKKRTEIRLGDTIAIGLILGCFLAIPINIIFFIFLSGLIIGILLCVHNEDLLYKKEIEIGYTK